MLHRFAAIAAFVAALAILVLVVGAQTTGSSGNPGQVAVADSSDAQKQISDLMDQYSQALLARDEAALDKIWADDLTFINLHGQLLTKQNRMDNIRTGATAFKAIQVTDKHIRTYGTVAVATCKVDLQAHYSGEEGSGSFAVTTVWARPKGTWQMVAVQMTRIGQ